MNENVFHVDKATKKKNLFYRRMDLPSRVGKGFIIIIFIISFNSGSKNDPKNTKILEKNLAFCGREIVGKCFDLFSKLFN